VAAPVRWNISFLAPRRFHPGACKRWQQITPVLNQAVEHGSSAQSAIISGFQLSAIFATASPAKAAAPFKSP
jgi:hypothetical protein